ncbi:MAG: PGPGW domain-containing protein [Candidatus Nanopelagicales bacterium]|jgi:uncharacterized protein (TIGR02611 family)|nr:PGPGW domain-containing protein [Candidatus Nanopelagicales bacterium]
MPSTAPTLPLSADDPTEETFRQHLRERSTAALRRVEQKAPPSVATRLQAVRERIRKRRTLDTAWRVMVLTLGLTLVTAGLMMFVLPGPGFGALILGLVVLASEFTWATRVLDPVKDAARKAQAAATDPRRRKRNLILGGIAGVIVAVVLIVYLGRYGLTIAPLVGLLDAFLDWFRGLFA